MLQVNMKGKSREREEGGKERESEGEGEKGAGFRTCSNQKRKLSIPLTFHLTDCHWYLRTRAHGISVSLQ